MSFATTQLITYQKQIQRFEKAYTSLIEGLSQPPRDEYGGSAPPLRFFPTSCGKGHNVSFAGQTFLLYPDYKFQDGDTLVCEVKVMRRGLGPEEKYTLQGRVGLLGGDGIQVTGHDSPLYLDQSYDVIFAALFFSQTQRPAR